MSARRRHLHAVPSDPVSGQTAMPTPETAPARAHGGMSAEDWRAARARSARSRDRGRCRAARTAATLGEPVDGQLELFNVLAEGEDR
ncbi:hypothetical protein [Amycolatopsis thermoflava]|uniref:hypothetical protein n=1 Tax=Amycolatopsis thermoflava TaxID=84480 RepID=UPI000407C4F2|nr:hypothetical protein [Amycolatopsis thermoflava]